jgi:hypothetical protein
MIARWAGNPGVPIKANVGYLSPNLLNVTSAAIAVGVSEFHLIAFFWRRRA